MSESVLCNHRKEDYNADLAVKSGAPGASRTHDTRFRKPLLYPLSYRGKGSLILAVIACLTQPKLDAQTLTPYLLSAYNKIGVQIWLSAKNGSITRQSDRR